MNNAVMIAIAAVAPAAEPAPAPGVAASAPARAVDEEGDRKIVLHAKSPYADVFVVDEGHLRYLRFDAVDGQDQSEIDLRDPRAVPMEYLRVAAAGLAFTPGRGRALVVGLGGGAFPMLLRRSIPAMRIDAVDIDPVVVDAAQRHFGVVADAHLRLIVRDGAAFVKETSSRYDLVLLDAYSGDGIPAHLAGEAFFTAVRGTLAPGGAVVANLALDDPATERVVTTAFARAFPSCTTLQGKSGGNLLLVGTTGPRPSEDALRRAFVRMTKEDRLPFPLAEDVVTIEPCPRVVSVPSTVR